MHEAPSADELVASALAEDLGVPAASLLAGGDPSVLARDVTSSAVVPAGVRFSGVVRAREGGVVCGLPLAASVYAMLSRAAALSEPVEVYPLVAEGSAVRGGEAVAEVEGEARAVLAGERTALNLLSTLSGIATEARRWADAAGGLTVTDTRKTLPGLRALSKYAVRVGGAANHRAGLHDMVLVKDNHLRWAGGVGEAVRRARENVPGLLVEVEADTLAQAVEAVRAGADLVLLDNMDDAELAEAVSAVREAAADAGRSVRTEASGGITFERLAGIAATGVDRVSAGAITLARPLDFGLDEEDR
ncbi:MAG: carboxylating nicotinate-nucleotide diphosphorylase [Coriobacteriia bacterium]|nr:carboxylating nicotinate-nucleotide diphosphorylase [Coriobacteriia bacterium]